MALLTFASCTPLAVRMRTSGGAPATARLSPLGSGDPSGHRAAFKKAVVASPGGAPVPFSRRRCTTGNDDGQSPLTDLEYFLEETKKFKKPHLTTAKKIPSNPLDAADIAKKCLKLIENLLRTYNTHPLPNDTLQEVCNIGRSFLELVEKWNSGSLTLRDIELVIPGLTRIAEIFPGEEDNTGENFWNVKDEAGLAPLYFLEEMKKFKESRPENPSVNARTVAVIAKMVPPLLEELLRKYSPHPLPHKTLEEVCDIGIWFMELEEQCSYGYVNDRNIEKAITKAHTNYQHLSWGLR